MDPPRNEKSSPDTNISFGYPKGKFMMTTALFMGVLFVLAMVIRTLPVRPPSFHITIIFGLLCLTLVLYGLSPLITSHTLEGHCLILRQGWYFRILVPQENILSVGPYEGLVYKSKVDIASVDDVNTLFVTSTRRDLVTLNLRKPQKVRWFFGKKVKAIVADVVTPDMFIREISKRISHGEKPSKATLKKKGRPRKILRSR